MSFPVTGVIDNFNRADGGLGTDWTSPADIGDSVPTILSNVVIGPSGAFSSSCYNLVSYGPDCEAYCTIPAVSTAFDDIALMTRLQNPASSTYCSYFLRFAAAAGIEFSRNYNDGNSGVLKSIALNAAVGWKVGMRTVTNNNDIWNLFYVDKGAGAGWEEVGQYNDIGAVVSFPLLANAGFLGFRQWCNAAVTRSMDDFSGGTFDKYSGMRIGR